MKSDMEGRKQIAVDFLNSIKFKYLDIFSCDNYHSNLINKALNNIEQKDFFHIIECCVSKLANKKCRYCYNSMDALLIHSNIQLNYKNLVVFFTSYFGSPLFIANAFFSSLKSHVYTDEGFVALNFFAVFFSKLYF
jgi:hypothetical protein